MANKELTSFEKLYGVNVNDKVEKKNGLNYLSWSWAWAEFKKLYPNARYNIVTYENGCPYFYDPNTGYMVMTEIVADEMCYEMWLPVMDGNNKAMKAEPYEIKTKYKTYTVQAATMFDINKTIMRCLVKNMAMFGLGLYIYAGEDLPDTDEEQHFEPPKQNKAKAEKPKKTEKSDEEIADEIKRLLTKSDDELKADLKKLLMDTNSDTKAFLAWASERYKRQIDNVDVMVGTELEDAIKVVSKNKKKGDK